MDPSSEQDVPKRSSLWFSGISHVEFSSGAFDKTTGIFCICLSLFSFIVFWPIISQISFEEAFFTPLIPMLIGLFGLFGVSALEALKVLFILSLMVSVIGVYLLTRELTRRQLTSILAAVLYLIPPIPIFVLSFFRQGFLENELGSAKSFFTIVYGDGAHFLALAILPFATIFVLRYLKNGLRFDLVFSAILCALILLANRSQSLALFLIMIVLFITQSFFGNVRTRIQRFFSVVMLSVGLVSFWYTPNFWYLGLRYVTGEFAGNIHFLFPLPFIVFLLILLFSFVFFARREDRMAIFVAFLTFTVFLAIIGIWFVSGHAFIPHPHRLLPNLNIFGSIVFALFLAMIIDRVRIFSMFSQKMRSLPVRIIASVSFGVFSFVLLTFVAYVLSPLAILVVAGSGGLWTRIRDSVLLDRQATLNLAGGNFQLIANRSNSGQEWLGVAISLIFLTILLFVIFKGAVDEQEAR